MYRVFIISDGTGRTAAQILDAALTQFPHIEIEINVRPEIRTRDQVIGVVTEAGKADGFIVHTVVSRQLRDHIVMSGKLHRVATIDLMGPLLAQLADKFAGAPAEKPGLFYMLNRAYFQRIEAMEFAIRHDDGQRVEELTKAEIVLVGVSRTFKTPLSMYLAFNGWYVANVPIVMGRPLPAILDDLPPASIFALTTDRNHLARIRQTRHKYLGGSTGDYADPSMIRLELMHAGKLLGAHPEWTKITVTNKPIEEIATEILDAVKRNSEEGS